MSDECHGEVCYRVTGHYGGEWDNTIWYSSEWKVEAVYNELKQGNWLQLSIERTDGLRKAGPDADWYDPENERYVGVSP